MRKFWRALSTSILAFLVVGASSFADVEARSISYDLNIPAEDLTTALQSFALASHQKLLYKAELTAGKTSRALKGNFTVEEAIGVLLSGTGLTYEITPSSVVLIKNRSDMRTSALARGDDGPPRGDPHGPTSTELASATQTPALMAQNSGGQPILATDNSTSGNSSGGVLGRSDLSEIIVTASKRPEELREVANSVTAFPQAALEQLGAQSMEDYIGRAPGVIFDASIPGLSNVTIRGIGTATAGPDQGQGTTGIYLNDIPLTDPGFAMGIPDVDVFDIQRVEVLRGPQGALFGTATLGGAVNYILNPVSLDRYDARFETGLSSTKNSDQVGYVVKGAVNLPLIEDTFGIRLTAIKRFDPGYLDNLGTGVTDANSHVVEDFRISALWSVNDRTSLNYFFFYDRSHNDDNYDAFTSLGELKRDTFLPEFSTFVNQVNSLKFDTNLDFAALTVLGAYSQKKQDSVLDFTLFGYDVPTSSPAAARTNSTSIETRLTSPSSAPLQWLVGIYHGLFDEYYPTPTLQGGVDIYNFTVQYDSIETSGFGEVTYRFTDQWRATVGGRYYHIDFDTGTAQGVPGTPSQNIYGTETSKGFSPKASLTFEPTHDLLAYALVSKGFRSGGVNLVPPLAGFPTPATYAPDSLVDYEIGMRPAWFDHRLTLDSTVFYVDWSHIQVRLNRPDFYSYAANAGKARNVGLENSLTWSPNDSFSFQANATYLDAELSQTLDLGNGTIVPSGATLPGASRWTTAELATYRAPILYRPFITLSHRFVSAASSGFPQSTGGTVPIGDYHDFDIRTGLSISHIDLTAYLNNVADKRGVTAGQVAGPYVQDFYIRPRTVGVQFDWRL